MLLNCYIFFLSSSNVAAFGEVQTPAVCFSSCQIVMEEVYKDVPVKYQAILVNQTLLPTRFSLGKVTKRTGEIMSKGDYSYHLAICPCLMFIDRVYRTFPFTCHQFFWKWIMTENESWLNQIWFCLFNLWKYEIIDKIAKLAKINGYIVYVLL